MQQSVVLGRLSNRDCSSVEIGPFLTVIGIDTAINDGLAMASSRNISSIPVNGSFGADILPASIVPVIGNSSPNQLIRGDLVLILV